MQARIKFMKRPSQHVLPNNLEDFIDNADSVVNTLIDVLSVAYVTAKKQGLSETQMDEFLEKSIRLHQCKEQQQKNQQIKLHI